MNVRNEAFTLPAWQPLAPQVAARLPGFVDERGSLDGKGAEASIAMHENFGFSQIGHMGKVGFKFDRWLGTVLLQKSLKDR